MNANVKTLKDPRWLMAISWPFVLAVPYLPGIPKPTLGGLAWKQELAFAGLLICSLVLVIKRQRIQLNPIRFQSSALLITGILFVLWSASSVAWAANPYSAAHYAFSWAAYLLFFILLQSVAERPRAMRATFYALGVLVWLLSISCLLEWLSGSAITDYSFRANLKPIFRGFSGFGETMAVVMPIFGALALSLRNSRQALLCGATALISWLAILQAFQRAPILGAIAALGFLGLGILIFKQCRPRGFLRVALLAGSFAILGFFQMAVFPANPAETSTTLQRLEAPTKGDESAKVRLLYWGVGLEMFRAHPVRGVGANNYEVAFPSAREQFAATHQGSALVGMNEHLLTQYAHNEYVQILAELGVVGVLLFMTIGFLLIRNFWIAIRTSKNPTLALGAGAGLLAFTLSSAASAFSFRWFGSGLVFFFAAGIVSYLAAGSREKAEVSKSFSKFRFAPAGALVFALLMFIGAGIQAVNGVTHAWAQTSGSAAEAENLYRQALRLNPYDPASHFDYGSLLYQQRRCAEAVKHLQFAVDHGFNTSTSYAVLAAAQEGAGDLSASERTLAVASRTYPRSTFLLVRHSAALSRMGNRQEADRQLARAMEVDAWSARGWYQLINFDIDAALKAAFEDPSLAKPGELEPQNAVFLVLKENERRLNIPAKSGWRGRVGAQIN